MSSPSDERRSRAAILISGSGSNLQAFIDRQRDGNLSLDIALVVSNRADAYGLVRAQATDIETCTIDHRAYQTREQFDRRLASVLENVDPGLIVLAGFMRILSPWFVRRFEGRILNIHPALLPKYPGLDTHARVLDAGDSHHGSTVHFVTEKLDGGPRILAGRLQVDPSESPDELQARVQAIEHRVYPQAAEWFASGRLDFRDGMAWLDDKPLREPIVMDF